MRRCAAAAAFRCKLRRTTQAQTESARGVCATNCLNNEWNFTQFSPSFVCLLHTHARTHKHWGRDTQTTHTHEIFAHFGFLYVSFIGLNFPACPFRASTGSDLLLICYFFSYFSTNNLRSVCVCVCLMLPTIIAYKSDEHFFVCLVRNKPTRLNRSNSNNKLNVNVRSFTVAVNEQQHRVRNIIYRSNDRIQVDNRLRREYCQIVGNCF